MNINILNDLCKTNVHLLTCAIYYFEFDVVGCIQYNKHSTKCIAFEEKSHVKLREQK